MLSILPPSSNLLPAAISAVLHPGLAIAGLALVAIPIIIHFLNRRRFRTVQWAAMDFLLQALRRNRRRMRFESLLLLLTRCLVIGLLGLALARPFGCADSALARVAGREAGLHVIIVDNSASMAYRHERDDAATHFDHARKLGVAIVSRLGDTGDQMAALVAAAAPAEAVIASPTYETSAVASAIEGLSQTWRGTDLAGALDRAVELAADAPNLPRTLHVITDDTASALAENQSLAEAARRAADQYRIVWHHLAAPGQSNQALLQVRPDDALVRRGFDTNFFATHQRFGGTSAEAVLSWRLDGQSVGASQPVTSAAEVQTVTASDPALQNALADGRAHVIEAGLTSSDAFPVDDVRRRVVEQVRDLPVLLVEGGRSAGNFGSGEILSLALQPAEESGYIAVTRISDLELAGRPLEEYRAIVLAGVGNIAEPTAQALADFARAGGTLMIWLGEAVTADNYNGVLQPRGLLPGALVQRVAAPEDGLLGFDFDPANVHPYLEAFRDRERSGLDVGAILLYWKIDLSEARPADVVLRFLPATPGTPGDPAVTTHPLGDGRVLLVTTAAGDPEWTLLPLRDNYVAFVHELLNHAVGDSSGGGLAWQTLEVGQVLRIPPTIQAATEPTLVSAAGQEIELDREIRPDGAGMWISQPLEEPGVYQLTMGSATWPVAVNLPTTESDLRPLAEQSVVAALGDIEIQWMGDELPSEAMAEDENRADFGWSLLLAVLLLAGVECFMAMRFGRHRR